MEFIVNDFYCPFVLHEADVKQILVTDRGGIVGRAILIDYAAWTEE